MAHPLLLEAERLKLARALGVARARLEFLPELGVAELRQLRDAASHYLFDQHHRLFQRIAASSRLVPAVITAKLSQHVFGPMISARVAGLMAPERAVDVSARLPVPFLAELTLDMDPASAPELLRGMPVSTVIAVARELRRRGEFITMARFVDNLQPETIRAVVDDALDDEALVRVGFYVESEDQLTQVMSLLPPGRLQSTVRLTTGDSRELRDAGVVLFAKVNDELRGRMGDAAATAGGDLLERMVRNLLEAGERDAVAAMAERMGPAHRPRVEALLAG